MHDDAAEEVIIIIIIIMNSQRNDVTQQHMSTGPFSIQDDQPVNGNKRLCDAQLGSYEFYNFVVFNNEFHATHCRTTQYISDDQLTELIRDKHSRETVAFVSMYCADTGTLLSSSSCMRLLHFLL